MNILNFEKQHMKEAAALALASYYEERRFVKELIRPMEFIDCKPCTDYDFVELPKTEYHFVYPLHLALNRHYCESPFFYEPQARNTGGIYDGLHAGRSTVLCGKAER